MAAGTTVSGAPSSSTPNQIDGSAFSTNVVYTTTALWGALTRFAFA
jgi:hypothetical protein